jgi:hypothetical protein
MKYIIALLLTFGAFAAQATTPTKRISLDIGRPENTFVLGPISRGSSEYIDCALYVRGTAYPTNDLSGSLWYSVANTSTTGVSISTVDADVINGHVYIQMSVTDSLGLSTTEADYPITYYASVVLTNATQTHVFDVGTLVLRWDAATAGAGSATLSNSAQPTYFTALTDTPSSYTGQGGKVVSVNTGGTALEFTTAGSGSGDLTAVQVSGSILTVASGTGPIPIVGLTTAAVQAAQITYTAATNLILSGTEFSLDGSGVASLALADSALQSYTETDPIWIAVSNTVTANALLGSTALQSEVQDIAAVVALDGDIGTGNITSAAGGTTLDMSSGKFYSSGGTVDISGGTGPALSGSAFSASIDATTGNQIVGWSVLTNQIALLGGTTYTAGTNLDLIGGTEFNLDAAAVASLALADSALQTTDLSGAAVNEVLTYSAAGWTNAAASGGATISNLTSGVFLEYNGEFSGYDDAIEVDHTGTNANNGPLLIYNMGADGGSPALYAVPAVIMKRQHGLTMWMNRAWDTNTATWVRAISGQVASGFEAGGEASWMHAYATNSTYAMSGNTAMLSARAIGYARVRGQDPAYDYVLQAHAPIFAEVIEDDPYGWRGTTGEYPFWIRSRSTSTPLGVFERIDAGSGGAGIRLRRAHGTTNTQTIVTDGLNLGDVTMWGFDGSDYQNAGGLRVRVDGTPSAGDMPSQLELTTTPDGTASPVARLYIMQDGKVGIATNAPSTSLEVLGTVTATAFAGDGSALTGIGGSSGIVSEFDAYNSVTQWIGVSTWTTMSANTEIIDPDSKWSGTVWTPAVGMAALRAGWNWTSALSDGDTIITRITKNGALFRRGDGQSMGGAATVQGRATWDFYNDSATNQYSVQILRSTGGSGNALKSESTDTYITGWVRVQ